MKKILLCALCLLLMACGGQNTKSTTEKGYAFNYMDNDIETDMDMEEVLKSLGEPIEYFESASCVFDEGLDKIYTYQSFEINTYPLEDRDYVSLIILKDDTVSTQEGISIGDSLEKVIETYGEGRKDAGLIEYEKGEMTLLFIIQDNTVVSIEYRSNIL